MLLKMKNKSKSDPKRMEDGQNKKFSSKNATTQRPPSHGSDLKVINPYHWHGKLVTNSRFVSKTCLYGSTT